MYLVSNATLQRELVVARAGATSVIAVYLNQAIRRRLGVDPERDKLNIVYGFGDEHFCLVAIRAIPADTALVPLRRCGDDGCGFNLRPKFLPRGAVPERPVELPHRWRGRYLIIDYRPLQISAARPLRLPVQALI